MYPKYLWQNGLPKYILCTDIDRTLLKDDCAPTEKKVYQKCVQEIVSLTKKHNIPLAAITSREFESVYADIDHHILPPFDMVFSSVGNRLYAKKNNRPEYIHNIAYAVPVFKRDEVYGVCKAFIEKVSQTFSDVSIQFDIRDSEENNWKHTQSLPLDEKISIKIISSRERIAIVQQMGKEYFPKSIKIIVSDDAYLNHNQILANIDIVSTDKGNPIQWLKERYPSHIIAAGDCLNDREMLFSQTALSIIVGEARKDILKEIYGLPTRTEFPYTYVTYKSHEHRFFIETKAKRKGPQSMLWALQYFLKQNSAI